MSLLIGSILVTVMAVEAPAWSRHAIDPGPGGADGIRLLTSGTDLWAVTAWEEAGIIRRYRCPAPAELRKPWPAETIGQVKDGEDALLLQPDWVVSAHEGGTRAIAMHRLGGGSWKRLPFDAPRQRWMQLAPVFAADGHLVSLLAGSKEAQAGISRADLREGKAAVWHRLRDAGWIMTLELVQADAVGQPALLYTDRRGANTALGLLRGWEGDKPSDERIAEGGEWMFAAWCSDFDGQSAIVSARKPMELWLHQRRGDAWHGQRVLADASNVGTAKGVAAGDLDGDGLCDIAFSCEEAHGLMGLGYLTRRGAAGGPWRLVDIGGNEGTKYDQVLLRDLDGDGDLDLLTCEERTIDAVLWYENPLRSRPSP